MDRIGNNQVMFVSVSRHYGLNSTYVEFQRVYSSEVYSNTSLHSMIRLENVVNRLGKPIVSTRDNSLTVNFPVIR